eukprot:TRINITY_DN55772_c0_g1_i1.p1 TRINITY_DN55772_c0_g1~~TRINITY_DN55772_c0_g1_i1.p1  ORF type:complete len:593 (+),score=173.53 TRINITY_DN55772_c0_g1_i1:70-1779(+)
MHGDHPPRAGLPAETAAAPDGAAGRVSIRTGAAATPLPEAPPGPHRQSTRSHSVPGDATSILLGGSEEDQEALITSLPSGDDRTLEELVDLQEEEERAQPGAARRVSLLARLGVLPISAALAAIDAAELHRSDGSGERATRLVQRLCRSPVLAAVASAALLRQYALCLLGYEEAEPAQAALVALEVRCSACGATCSAADRFCCACGAPGEAGRPAREELAEYRKLQVERGDATPQLTDAVAVTLRLRNLLRFFGKARAVGTLPVRYLHRLLREVHCTAVSLSVLDMLQGPGLPPEKGTVDPQVEEPHETLLTLLRLLREDEEVFVPAGWGGGADTEGGDPPATLWCCFRMHQGSVVGRVDNVGPSRAHAGHELFSRDSERPFVQSLGITVASPLNGEDWGQLGQWVQGIAGLHRDSRRHLPRREAFEIVYPPKLVEDCREQHKEHPFLSQLALSPPQPPCAAGLASHLQGMMTRMLFTGGGVATALAFRAAEIALAVEDAALARDGPTAHAAAGSTVETPRMGQLEGHPCRSCGWCPAGKGGEGVRGVQFWVARFRSLHGQATAPAGTA